MRRLQGHLAAERLVTLCGSGGVGKTRLALETAQRANLHCVFVNLADLPDAGRLPEIVLKSLGALPQVTSDALPQLIGVLEQRGLELLILDNAEHLLDAVAGLTVRLLEALPTLHLLVISRQRLDLPGEVILPLLPLPPPPLAAEPSQLQQYPAVALFMDRAQNARPDFTLTPRHAAAVADICRRLQGVPLALELAAARITAQTPEQIGMALSQNLLDLKSRQRGLSPRHRSLRAAIQSSLDLLSDDLRRFFGQMSVFQGGWTIEAARAVTRSVQAEEFLEEFVSRSLVVAQEVETDGVMRYSFLDTLRQLAAEQLTPEEHQTCVQRHAEYFLALAARVREDDIRTLPPLDAEQENLLIGLAWGQERRGECFWNGLIGALIHAFIRGHHRLALRWIDEGLPFVALCSDPALRFRLRYAACLILPDVGRFEQAEHIAQEIQADAAIHGSLVEAAYSAVIRGYVANTRGQMETAVRLHRDVLLQARRLRNAALLESCLSHASGTLYDYSVLLGMETEAGRMVLQEAEALARELRALVSSYSRRVPLAALLVTSTLIGQNRKVEGYAFLKETQRACIALGTTSELMYTFIYESEIALERGLLEQAVLRYGAFLALQERMGYSLARAETVRPAWTHKITTELKTKIGVETFDALVLRGRRTAPDVLAAENLLSQTFSQSFS